MKCSIIDILTKITIDIDLNNSNESAGTMYLYNKILSNVNVWIQGQITSTTQDDLYLHINDGSGNILVQLFSNQVYHHGKYINLSIGQYVLVVGVIDLDLVYNEDKIRGNNNHVGYTNAKIISQCISILDDPNYEKLWVKELSNKEKSH